MSDIKIRKKHLFNLSSNEKLNEAKIVNGNPSGIVDFTNPTRPIYRQLYELMQTNTWFPSEANMGLDKIPFKSLSSEEKKAYLTVLAQLIMNDSIQTDQLVENIKPYITDPVASNCLTWQAGQESLHSFSYATMVEELLEGDEAKEVYYLQHSDKMLMKKDKAIESMYIDIGTAADEVTDKAFLKALAANNILEGNIFYSGFTVLWSFGKKLIGTAKMISFIERDEFSHVQIFKNIYRHTAEDLYGDKNAVPSDIKKEIRDLIDYMTGIEIEWSLYITKGLLGFTPKTVEQYIKNKANQICDNLLLERLFKDVDNGGVIERVIEKTYSFRTDTKTNFFENKVMDYAKGSLKIDF